MALDLDFSALRATLANRNFAIFSAGNAASLLGSWVQKVAVGWLTWELTHSATWLGAVAMAEFLPVIFLAPITGVMADRFDRRRIAVIGQVLATVQAASLAALTLTGHITPVLILVLQTFQGFIQPLIQTARLVIAPTLVPRANVGHAIAATSMIFNITRIIGPALSGALIASIGAGYAFALNAVSYLFVIRAMMALTLEPHKPAPAQRISLAASMWADFVAGWRYTIAHPTLKWVIPIIVTAGMLTWPVGDLMAGIADREFGRGVAALAIFTSAQGLGAIFGALYLVQRKDSIGIEKIFRRCIMLNGIFVAIFAVTKIFWLAVPLYAVNGMFMVVGGATSQTVIQSQAAEEMRGRALSIWYTATRAALALGAISLGALASVFGFTAPLLAAGVLTFLAALFMGRGRTAS